MTTTAGSGAQPDASMRPGAARPRSVAAEFGARVAGRLGLMLVGLLVAVLALVAVGAAAGRFRAVPAGTRGSDVRADGSDLLIVVPVATERVAVGDTLLAQPDHTDHDVLFRVTALDSWTGVVYARDPHGTVQTLHVGSHPWRVSERLPALGTPYRYLIGTIQAVVLLLFAMALVGRAALQRRTRLAAWQEARARPSLWRRPWWWTRLAAGATAMLGVLSLTASATFTGSVSVTQASITAGHMQLTVPGAGSTNRLTLGATGIAPGDTMSRALDLSVDNTTTSGIISSVTLAVSATTSSNLDTDSHGLAIWIQKCSVAYTESGSSPAFSYSCGGTSADVLGTQGSPVSVVTLKSSAQTLTGISTSANSTTHLMVQIQFPGGASNDDTTFQDKISALQFTFAGVQRSGSAH